MPELVVKKEVKFMLNASKKPVDIGLRTGIFRVSLLPVSKKWVAVTY